MDAKTRHGYLVIADISGFTSYLAKVELEHAHEILTDLLETIVREFKTLLTISKLEGDAVFAYIQETNFINGENLLDLIENTYFSFRRQRETSRRNTTCTCRACQSIPTLDLKFFVHHGDFIVQKVSGIHELVGSDVNLIHRLMKNHVTEKTGWTAYILFTSRATQSLGMQVEGIHEQLESYDHLGEIKVHCLDLHKRYNDMLKAKRVFISQDEADFTFTYDFNAPPPQLWHWLTDLEKKTLLGGEETKFTPKSRPGGRYGPGASNHCAHGKNLKGSLIETILDWRPFDYYTFDATEGKSNIRQTYKLEALSNGSRTRLHIHATMLSPKLPKFIRRMMFKIIFVRILLTMCQTLDKFIDRENNADLGNSFAQVTA